MENLSWDIDQARKQGVVCCFLATPSTKAVPMVGTEDVGRVGAELLDARTGVGSKSSNSRVPDWVTQNENRIGTHERRLRRPVRPEAVPP